MYYCLVSQVLYILNAENGCDVTRYFYTSSLELTLTQLHVCSLSHLKLTPLKMGGSPGIWTRDLLHPKPVITHSTPRLWRCLASVSVLIEAYGWWHSQILNNFLHVIQWALVRLCWVRVLIMLLKCWVISNICLPLKFVMIS